MSGKTEIDPRRILTVRRGKRDREAVIYWMSRDQRVRDNWALLYARQLAEEGNVPLAVVFTLSDSFLGAMRRQYEFMFGGLQEVESSLRGLGIPFFVLRGEPPAELNRFVRQYRAGTVVSDFDPLRIKRQWKKTFLDSTEADFHTVDTHNIVPAFFASGKQEYGAHTLRPKIHRVLQSFLVPFPEQEPMAGNRTADPVDWEAIRSSLDRREGIHPEGGPENLGRADDEDFRAAGGTDLPADQPEPGEKAAMDTLDAFIHSRLDGYASRKNDPNAGAVSGLSPYLHFGHISSQRVALEILRERAGDENTESFLEELIVRKELSDNYCLYNPDYDSLKRIPPWARKTLEEHRKDEREHLYDLATFEAGKTHEDLWNAAQMEMVKSGSMHGYLRMYWAKKILEWSESPEEAMRIAVYLNDRYQLDGRDPNGYTGCAWSVAGVHDRAWGERPVFGKIRFMNEKGCRRKFDVDAYIARWL